jgi:hypothetical protein
MKNKPEEYFRRKLDEIRIQQKSFVITVTVSSKALLASYQASYREQEAAHDCRNCYTPSCDRQGTNNVR